MFAQAKCENLKYFLYFTDVRNHKNVNDGYIDLCLKFSRPTLHKDQFLYLLQFIQFNAIFSVLKS